MNGVHSGISDRWTSDQLLVALLHALDRAHADHCRRFNRPFSLQSYWTFLREVMPANLRPVLRNVYRASADRALAPFARRDHVHAMISFLGTDPETLVALIPFIKQAIAAIQNGVAKHAEEITRNEFDTALLIEHRKRHMELTNASLIVLKESWQESTGRKATLQHYMAFILGGNSWIYTHRLESRLRTDDPQPKHMIFLYRTFEQTLLSAAVSNYKKAPGHCHPHKKYARAALAAIRNMRRHAWENYLCVEALHTLNWKPSK